MTRFLVIADPAGGNQRVIDRAVDMAARSGAELLIVGFVYEHVANLTDGKDGPLEAEVKDKLLAQHRKDILRRLREARGRARKPVATVEVHWEKRVADWVAERSAQGDIDLVLKGIHRSATLTYTPTDWQLLRHCRCSVLLVAEKHWKKSGHVLAAVDLGTRSRGKKALNRRVVEEAAALAKLYDCNLIISYALPVSRVLRDLDIIDEKALRRRANQRLKEFCQALEDDGITVDDKRLVTGAPEKALVNAAAKSKAGLVVLGCVGRKRLAGKVIGNTAEQILRLSKADVLAVKPD